MTILSRLFRTVLSMSQAGAAAILLAVLLRFCLSKLPKKYRFILWAAVLVRLICPVFPEFTFSPMPRQTYAQPQTAAVQVQPVQLMPVQTVSDPSISQTVPAPAEPSVPSQFPEAPEALDPPDLPAPPSPAAVRTALETDWAALVWLGGCAVMLLYLFLSWFRLKRSLATAWKTGGDTWELDGLPGPFVMGFFRPRIYLPAGLEGRARELVLLHERAHLARRDHLLKPLAFCVLALHWFNPLAWLAFALMSRDMEFACDERVLARLGEDAKADYSSCLLSFAAPAPRFAGSPLAFGESHAGSRIKNVLNYKKPAFWLVLGAVLILTAIAALLLTDPAKERPAGLSPAVLSETADAAITPLTHFRTVSYQGDQEQTLLAADGPTLLTARNEPVPQSSPYFAEEGYQHITRELFLYDTVNENITYLSGLIHGDELAVSAVLTKDYAVVSVLRWLGRSSKGELLYDIRWYDRHDGSVTVRQTGPCSRFYVPDLAALSDGSVVICTREPDGTGLAVYVTGKDGHVKYTHEFPKGDYSFPAVLTASGNNYLLREMDLDGSAIFYRGTSGGELTRYAPESEGRISTGVYLLGDAIVYCEHFYAESYFSSPNRTILHAISPDGAELAQADVSELSPAILASGPSVLLARAHTGSPGSQPLMLISIEHGAFVFRPLEITDSYGFTLAADSGGAYYLDYQRRLNLDSQENAWTVNLLRVTPGEEPLEYSTSYFQVVDTVQDDLTLMSSPVWQAAETVLRRQTLLGVPEEERIDAWRIIGITLMAGGLEDFAIEVDYAYCRDDGPLHRGDTRISPQIVEITLTADALENGSVHSSDTRSGSWWRSSTQIRARQSEDDTRLYEIAAVDQPNLASGLPPVYRTLYTTPGWYPGKALSLDDLPQRVATIPAEDDSILLLAELPQADIGIYYLPGLVEHYVAIRFGAHLQVFEQTSLTPRFIFPELDWRDWDGDGENELAVTYYVGSGTGVSITELHIYEWDGAQWTDHRFDTRALLERINQQQSIEISEDRKHATIHLGTDVIQADAGEEYHFSGFEFPGMIVDYLLTDEGLYFSTIGGSTAEEWPYGFYLQTFSADGFISYDGQDFHIDTLEFTQSM